MIPRGGEHLIEFVSMNSRIPILKNDRGMCHVYIHEDANAAMAIQIVQNAKHNDLGFAMQWRRYSFMRVFASTLLPRIHACISAGELKHTPVEWMCDAASLKILSGLPCVHPLKENSFDTEYLDYRMNCKVVASLDEAIAHIEKHTSKHSEAIVADSEEAAEKFLEEVDAACVYWNASTRFTDGFELGLGGEIGVSTQKLHARGPVGLRELTSLRWVLEERTNQKMRVGILGAGKMGEALIRV